MATIHSHQRVQTDDKAYLPLLAIWTQLMIKTTINNNLLIHDSRITTATSNNTTMGLWLYTVQTSVRLAMDSPHWTFLILFILGHYLQFLYAHSVTKQLFMSYCMLKISKECSPWHTARSIITNKVYTYYTNSISMLKRLDIYTVFISWRLIAFENHCPSSHKRTGA